MLARYKLRHFLFADVTEFRNPRPDFLTGIILIFPAMGERDFDFPNKRREKNALDWDRCLDTLAVYGVVHRTIRLLWKYWDRLTMVARSSRYFGLPSKGYCSATQGNLLFPTLFNVVVDAAIRHWVTVVVPTADGLEGCDLLLG